MEGSVTDTKLSAVEELQRLQQAAYGQQPLGGNSVLNSSEAQPMDLGSMTIFPADVMPPTTADQAASFLGQPSLANDPRLNLVLGSQTQDAPLDTVSPAEVNPVIGPRSSALELASTQSFGIHDVAKIPHESEHAASPSSSDDLEPEPSMPSHLVPADAIGQSEYLVTLPFQSSRRSVYISLHTEYGEALKGINNLNTNGTPPDPEPGLLPKVDDLFQSLLNLCDLPDMIEGLAEMDYNSQKKHAIQTNCKFSFVHEFLQHTRELDRIILIVCRDGAVFDLLNALVETMGCKFIIHEEKEALKGQDPTVVLASSSQDAEDLPTDLDCIIEFDSSCQTSNLAHQIRTTKNSKGRLPLTLTLAVSYSLDHLMIKAPPPDPLDETGSKSHLAFGLYHCLSYLRSPMRGYPDPPQLGITFGELLRNPDADVEWSPTPLPEQVYNPYSTQPSIYANSTREDSAAASVLGRKRQLDDVDDDRSKRVRLVMRDGGTSQNDASARYSQVAELVAKISALEIIIQKKDDSLRSKSDCEAWYRQNNTNLRAQVESHIKTTRRTAKHYEAALKDRSKFEAEAIKFKEGQKAAEEELEAEKAKTASLQQKNMDLEKQIREMRTAMEEHADPDISKIAVLENKVEELEQLAQKEEKRASNACGDLEFARQQYQNASKAASELGIKNAELEKEKRELEAKASENLRKIHEANTKGQATSLMRQLKEKDLMIRDREAAMQRLEEQLAVLRNGRRETRQSSVPRSPRLGITSMSPRPGVQFTSGRTIPGGSRGESPASGPGGAYGDAVGLGAGISGRWGYLRD